MTYRKLQHYVQQFLREEPKSFTMEEFSAWVEKSGAPLTSQDREILPGYLIRYGYVTDDETDFFHPSEAFIDFDIRIILTELEIKRKILIPGHRFIPLLSSSDNPWQSRLVDSSGFELPVKQEKFTLGDLGTFFSLFDSDSLLRYLQAENPENIQLFMESDGAPQTEIVLTVYDLKPWMDKLSPVQIAGLLVHRKGGYKFDFTIQPLSFSEINLTDFEKKKNFIAALDTVFDELTKAYGSTLHAEDQIALAYYRVRKPYALKPPLHFGGYLNESDRFALFTNNENAMIWPKGSSIPMDSQESSELNALLSRLEIALSEEEIEAFIRDEFYSGKPDKARMKDRCFRNRELIFSSKKEEMRFHSLINELWEEIESLYSPEADSLKGPLRKRILKLQQEQLLFIRSLDISEREFLAIEDSMEELSQFSGYLSTILVLLNNDESDPFTNGSLLDQVKDMLFDLEASQAGILRDISLALQKVKSPAVRPSRKRRRSREDIFQFKVLLKGSKPPVWRRIALPGNFSLADLHRAIQISMGWQDYHLHSFEINGTCYDDPESRDDFDFWSEPARSEKNAQLQKLGLREGMKFSYEYDFGDGWVHIIQVEKIFSAEELSGSREQNVMCLTGRKACPPEDCGGIFGYYQILEILEDPDHPEYDETLEWLDDLFDPDFVDLEEINSELYEEFN